MQKRCEAMPWVRRDSSSAGLMQQVEVVQAYSAIIEEISAGIEVLEWARRVEGIQEVCFWAG